MSVPTPPAPRRLITTHNAAGQAIIDTSLPEEPPSQTFPSGARFTTAYTFPTDKNTTLADDADLAAYKAHLVSPAPKASVVQYVECPPLTKAPMHRTETLDFGVVIEGEMEMILDSGETRILKKGDSCVQRGTMHAWRNPSETEWVRMVFFMQPIEGGKEAGMA